MAQGPINRPKDGIAALSGIIETDWAPYTFTMNWIFTQPEVDVHFEKGEPFCHIFPVQRGLLASVEPEIRAIVVASRSWSSNIKRGTRAASNFNAELQQPGSQAQAERWQKIVLSRAFAGRQRSAGRGSHHAAAAAAVYVALTPVTFACTRAEWRDAAGNGRRPKADTMTGSQWRSLASVDFAPLREARMQAYYAAQWLARAARAYIRPAPDDGHTNLGWDDGFDGFTTHPLARRAYGLACGSRI